jgi:hypothetical protein
MIYKKGEDRKIENEKKDKERTRRGQGGKEVKKN